MKIFLAHKSSDKPIVHIFKDCLPQFLSTWLDEDSLCWGDPLSTKIRKSVQEESDYIIVFLSRDTLNSTWVQTELGWALNREKQLDRTFVLPIVLEDGVPLPPEFENRLYLKLADWSKRSIRHLAMIATDHIFELIVSCWPRHELHLRAFIQRMLLDGDRGRKIWSRKILQLPLTESAVTMILRALKHAITRVKDCLKTSTEQKINVRANVFLPTTDTICFGDACNLTIPKLQDGQTPWLAVGMTDPKELSLVLRPRDGATGRVFIHEKAVGTIINSKWQARKKKGQDPNIVERWSYVPLSPDEEDLGTDDTGDDSDDGSTIPVGSPDLDVVENDVTWIVSIPIMRQVNGALITVGVFNVDCLEHNVQREDLRLIFAAAAPFAAVISGAVQNVPLEDISIINLKG